MISRPAQVWREMQFIMQTVPSLGGKIAYKQIPTGSDKINSFGSNEISLHLITKGFPFYIKLMLLNKKSGEIVSKRDV